MSVTYVVRFQVFPNQLERFMSLLNGVLDAMRDEPNFHEAVLHRDPDHPHRLMLYETWDSHEDVLAEQLNRPYRQVWHEALPDMLVKPRDITIWHTLRADRRHTSGRDAGRYDEPQAERQAGQQGAVRHNEWQAERQAGQRAEQQLDLHAERRAEQHR
jgi:autoinducer 2-degrading protein